MQRIIVAISSSEIFSLKEQSSFAASGRDRQAMAFGEKQVTIAPGRTVLVTNARQYAGEGSVAALLATGNLVLAHDATFVSRAERDTYEAEHAGVVALAVVHPDDIVDEILGQHGSPDAVVSNDVHPIRRGRIEDLEIASFRETFEAVTIFPIRLTQCLLRGRGAFVYVTSARQERPEIGCSVPTAIRAATTAFARALAQEVAADGIQVNVVAPNYLYSELYYPKARFVADEEGRRQIASVVPMGRLGTQAEVGALVAFLASGASPFTTGQVIAFTGGWST